MSDHVQAQAPIPPNCLILPLHIYLTRSQMTVEQLKSSVVTRPSFDPFGDHGGARTHRTSVQRSIVPAGPHCLTQRQAPTDISVDSMDFATSMKQSSAIDPATFDACYKEAKRRMLMCSNRIIDEQALTHMKSEVHEGYRQIKASMKEAQEVDSV